MGCERNIELDSAIEAVVRGELTDADIEAVYTVEDCDQDGDPIIRVIVVFKTASRFDAKKARSLTHRIFPVVKKGIRDAFPIVSFLSKADYARVSAAA